MREDVIKHQKLPIPDHQGPPLTNQPVHLASSPARGLNPTNHILVPPDKVEKCGEHGEHAPGTLKVFPRNTQCKEAIQRMFE